MRIEEAIDIIKSECYVFNPLNFDRSTMVNTALDIAVKALEQEEMVNKVVNGTPLPKGYGKLIAEPTEEDIANTIGGQNDFTECIKDVVKAVFDNATTIIDTDISRKE